MHNGVRVVKDVDHGAHIITANNVTESHSGDGLIVILFDERDRNLPAVVTSMNHPTNSLFRELEYDLAKAQEEIQFLKSRRSVRLSAIIPRVGLIEVTGAPD
jgi:hypothetical protein